MTRLKTLFDLLRETFKEWNEDNAPRLAAALAYYTAFSLAPLLVVVIALAGFVFSEDTARTEVLSQIQRAAGADAAELVAGLIESATAPGAGIFSTILGIITLILGALGAFNQIQGALDTIWDVDQIQRPGGLMVFIKDKLLSFGMVLVIGFLLLVSLVLSTVLSVFDGYLQGLFPGADILVRVVSAGLTFGITTLLFAMIYKFLPHVRIEWRDVLVGAAVTSLLFALGRFLLGLYLANSSTSSAYGAAGSFVLILLWIYYSAQIVMFGAEFTQVYARRYGSKILPWHMQAAIEAAEGQTPAPQSAYTRPLPPDDVLPRTRNTTLPPRRGNLIAELVFAVGTIFVSLIASRIGRRRDQPTQ